jgi:hypothetical protein
MMDDGWISKGGVMEKDDDGKEEEEKKREKWKGGQRRRKKKSNRLSLSGEWNKVGRRVLLLLALACLPFACLPFACMPYLFARGVDWMRLDRMDTYTWPCLVCQCVCSSDGGRHAKQHLHTRPRL